MRIYTLPAPPRPHFGGINRLFFFALILFFLSCPSLLSAVVVTDSSDWEADFAGGSVTIDLESNVSLSIEQHFAGQGTFDFNGNGNTLSLTASNTWTRFADRGSNRTYADVVWNHHSGTFEMSATAPHMRLQFAREGYDATVNLFGGSFVIDFPANVTYIGTHGGEAQGTFNFLGGDLIANGFTFTDGNAANGGVFNFFTNQTDSYLILTGDQQTYLQNLVSGNVSFGAVYLDDALASADTLSEWLIRYDDSENRTYLSVAIPDILSAMTGYWDLTTSWATGAVPTAENTPQIRDGHHITVRNPGAVSDGLTVTGQDSKLIIASGADLTLSDALLLCGASAADIAGTLTAKSVRFTQGEVALAGRLNISENSNFHQINVSGRDAVLQNAMNASVGTLRMAPNAAFTKTGVGEMTVAKLAAQEDNAITVQAGRMVFRQGEAFQNVTSLNLAGGTAVITSASEQIAGLRQYYFDEDLASTVANAATYVDIVASNGTIANLFSGKTSEMSYVQVDDRIGWNTGSTNYLFNNGCRVKDDFTYVWTGFFTPETTQDFQMVLSEIDDAGAFCIDINGDGVFGQGEVFSTLFPNRNVTGNLGTLTAGETYGVMFAFGEIEGDEMWKFELNGQVPMTTADTTGTWTTPSDTLTAGDYSQMAINVSESSVLELNAGTGTTFKGLEIAAGKKLTLAGSATDFSVGLLTTGAGRAEMDFSGGQLRVLNTLSPGGDAAIGTFALTGSLALNADSEFIVNLTDDGAGGFLSDQLEIDGALIFPAVGEEGLKLLVGYDGNAAIQTDDEFLLATITGTADGDLSNYEIFALPGLDVSTATLKWESILGGAGSELYMSGISSTAAGGQVPEPATWLLLLMGAVLLLRRKKL